MATVESLELRSEELLVLVTPENGADIRQITDTRTATDLLFTTPWSRRGLTPAAAGWDSQSRWLAAYRGGWQLLCPHAGPECWSGGARWGFHGEASLSSWDVTDSGPASVTLETSLLCAPLDLRRHIEVDGPVVRVRDEVTNTSPDPLTFTLMQHPGFAGPLVENGCRLFTGARTLIADAEAPGTLLAADSVHSLPNVVTAAGDEVDLAVLPAPDEVREIFGCLADFADPYFALVNETLDLGVGMRWDAEIYPYAWLWQEFGATRTFPWFGRARVVGVEPSTTLPGEGIVDGRERGVGMLLAGGQSRTSTVELSVFSPRGNIF